jgi:hypothetical protein
MWTKANELSRWSMEMMGYPYALYTRPWGTTCVYDDDVFLNNSEPTELIFL